MIREGYFVDSIRTAIYRFRMVPQRKFERALRLVGRHYKTVMDELAEEVIEQEEEFGKGRFGRADEIIEKYYHRLQPICTVYTNLRNVGGAENPKGEEALSKEQFRCFGCGGVIEANEQECRKCRWTWK